MRARRPAARSVALLTCLGVLVTPAPAGAATAADTSTGTAVAAAAGSPGPALRWRLTAPAGAADRTATADPGVAATVELSDDGRPTLRVDRGETTVLEPSALGIHTADTDFSTGLRFAGQSSRHLQERYATTSGRRLRHTADAAETTLRFTKDGNRLDLVVRVDADGVAYRYRLYAPSWVAVVGEASEYAVPRTADAFLLPYDNGRSDYESIHVHSTVVAAAPVEYGYPALFHVGDSWLLVTESDLDSRYGGSRLTLDADTRRFQVTLPDPAEVSRAPLSTPWRAMIVGDLAAVTESDLVTDLAAPSKIADTSWIKPGRAAWSWWSGGNSGSLDVQKQYVDYAGRQGWEYTLVDSGWNAAWVPELVQYARERNVAILLWVRWQTVDTQSELDRLLPLYKSWGVAGLKIDFMESDGQDRMRWYDRVLAATARHRLVLNFHGGTIPRGTERTWPHLLTVEAVRGGEGTRPNPTRVPYPPSHYVTVPFTRNLQGPMDWTPVTFSGVRLNSDAAELGLSVLYESGIQHFADSPANYARYPLAERFLRAVPAVWDETRLLAGDPGDHVQLARKRGADWFLGAATAGAGRTLSAGLGFLGGGEWLAEIYGDGPDGRITLTTRRVTAADTLAVPTAVNGGFAAQLCPAAPGVTGCAAGQVPGARTRPFIRYRG